MLGTILSFDQFVDEVEKMCRAFSLAEQISWLILLLASKSFLRAEVEAIQGPQIHDWCSERHCRECGESESLRCSNNALPSRCGDLCGCCQSCVRFRDLGESCGSQLAVRSSADVNFQDSRLAVTILATATCKRGLVCAAFICQRRHEEVESINEAGAGLDDKSLNIEARGSSESFDSKNDPINLENQSQFTYQHYNYNDVEDQSSNVVTAGLITLPASSTVPQSTSVITDVLSNIGSHKHEVLRKLPTPGVDSPAYKSQEPALKNPKILLGSPRSFLNVIIAGREFQLIYGHDALADLALLLDSLDRSHPGSILDEFEATNLHERLKNVLDCIDKKNEQPAVKKESNSSLKTLETPNNPRNESEKFSEKVRRSRGLSPHRNFIIAPTPRTLIERFRKKREAEDVEKLLDFVGLEHRSSDRSSAPEIAKSEGRTYDGPNTKFLLYDFLNEAPRATKGVDRHWLVARQANSADNLSADEATKLDDTEFALNIHITGIPRPVNTAGYPSLGLEQGGDESERSVENYSNYDQKLEVFVSEANSEVSVPSATGKPEASSRVEVAEWEKKLENDETDRATNNYWDTSSVAPQFSGNVYEFSFPENPTTLHDDSLRELFIRVNKTVDEFRARLDRIETRIVAIGSSLLDGLSRLRSNEKSGITGAGKSVDSKLPSTSNANAAGAAMTGQSLDYAAAEEANRLIEKAAPAQPPQKRIRFVKGTWSESRRPQWRSLQLRPSSTGSQKNFRAGRRRFNRTRGDAVDHLPQQNFPGKKLTRLPDGSERRISGTETQTSSVKKWPEEDTAKVPGQINPPALLSNAGYQNFREFFSAAQPVARQSSVPLDGLFSRDQLSSGVAADTLLGVGSASNDRTLWPSNLGWRRAPSLERSKRTSTPETPADSEAIFASETQIPSPVGSETSEGLGGELEGMSEEFGAATMGHSMGDDFSENYGEGSNAWISDAWNLEPSFGLLMVEGQSSKLEQSSSGSLAMPMEDDRVAESRENREMDDSWDHIRPEYLDYSERARESEDEQPTVEAGMTEAPVNRPRTRRTGSDYYNRKKRSIGTNFRNLGAEHKRREDFNESSKVNASIYLIFNKAPVTSSNKSSSILFPDLKDVVEKSSGKIVPSSRLFRKRSKRGVQVVDWLRAAQEYHERLREVRNAALKTWLASREQLEDANVTNVKLFTREVPSYLEKYYIVGDQSTRGGEQDQNSSVGSGDPGKSMVSNNLLGKIVTDQASHLEDRPEENAKSSSEQRSETSSSDVPRRFTIVTTGNSTIRIEEMPKNDEATLRQSGQGSINSELPKDFASSDGEDFDHMYESFDTEDEDFDFGDQSFAISEGATSKGSPGEYAEDDEIAELFSRSKRDSPLFLFKVRPRTNQEEVLTWPSNWKDLASKYLKLNYKSEKM